jgi:DNA-binding MarR family transcriptional regulator
VNKRKLGLRDLDKDILISVPRKVKVYREGGWLMLSQDKILEIVTEKRYTGDTLRVLLFFISVAEYDNRIRNYTQKKIAEKLRIGQPKVSIAIKILERDRIIYVPDDETKEYYFSNDLLTKGTHKYKKTAESPE